MRRLVCLEPVAAAVVAGCPSLIGLICMNTFDASSASRQPTDHSTGAP